MLMDSVRFVILEYSETQGRWNVHDVIEIKMFTRNWTYANNTVGKWMAHLHSLYASDGSIGKTLENGHERYKIEMHFVDSKSRTEVKSKTWECANHDGKCTYIQQTDPAHDSCIYCRQPEERK
jgi:hypothetical protein